MKLFQKKKLRKLYSEKEQNEIRKFHVMLLKMKKKRPHIKEIRLINLIYPDQNIIFK
jgi:hypothetical protein